MPCASCGNGDENVNINPLDTCSNGFMQCGNPCTTLPVNTANSETLPSQIDNFTAQFFGEVIKTEVNGVVSWSLPCSLETGLPSNLRGPTEPLACYFLRLFGEGVKGTPGNEGAPGADGKNGVPAFTQLTQQFSQPTLNNPQIQIRVVPNPALVAGMLLFVDHSGWYRLEGVTPTGAIFVTLLNPVLNPLPVIPVGSLVLPSGAQGLSVAGAQGQKGQKGDKGNTGAKGPDGDPGLPGLPSPVSGVTNVNGQYHDDAGTLFTNTNADTNWHEVDFVSSKPKLTLPAIGTYLITANTEIRANTDGVAVFVQLFNVTTNLVVAGTLGFNQSQRYRMIPMSAILTTVGVNEVVRLEASGKSEKIDPLSTTLTYVQLS